MHDSDMDRRKKEKAYKKKEEKANSGNERRRTDVDPVITAEYFPLVVSFARCIDTCASRRIRMQDWIARDRTLAAN